MQLDNLAEIYSLIVTIDQLEKAYIRDAVSSNDYTEACQRLLGQYATLLRSQELEQEFGDIDTFCIKYRVQCPNGVSRIKVGVPATVEISSVAPTAPTASTQPSAPTLNPQAVAEATGSFITAMDGLRLGYRSKDQLHPLLSALVTSLNRVTTKDFDGRGKLIQWLVTLNKLKINDQLDDDQVRQCEFDLDIAYKNFYGILA